MKLDVPLPKPRWRTYRSFIRNFDVENFNYELNERLVDLNYTGNRNVNEMYEIFTNTISAVTDKYVPLKKKKSLSKPVLYMNKTLKKLFIRKECSLIDIKIIDLLAIRKNSDSKEILSLN